MYGPVSLLRDRKPDSLYTLCVFVWPVDSLSPALVSLQRDIACCFCFFFFVLLYAPFCSQDGFLQLLQPASCSMTLSRYIHLQSTKYLPLPLGILVELFAVGVDAIF